jgi:hypothetical protein
MTVRTLDGEWDCLILRFLPDKDHASDGRELFPLFVAVDPETGEVDLLR